jgi:TP901 family phage tail tape measure protein
MTSRELNIVIKAQNLAGRALTSVKKDLGGIGKNVSRGLGTAARNIERGVFIAGGAAVGGLALAIKTAADFEDAFAGVRKTIDETQLAAAGMTFESLQDQFREMARTMPIAFEDLSAIGEAAGALGIKAQDIAGFTEVVAKLGVTTDLTSEAAADSLGRLGTILGLNAKGFEEVGDALVNLGNKGASTESEILAVAKRFAASGKAAGLTKEEILALSSTATSMGIEVEAAGSSLSRLFDSVATNIGTSNSKAKVFAKSLGLSAGDFKKAWKRDAIGTFQDFLKVLDSMDQFEAAKLLKDIGVTGVRDVRALRLLSDGWRQVGRDIDTAKESQGALDEEAQKRFATTASKWKTFQNILRDIGFVVGREILPIINDLMTDMANFLATDASQASIKQFAKDLARNIRDVAEWAKSLDWNAIANALKTAAGAAKGVLEAFLAMPPWVQAAIATGWGLNKLTGGAVGSIVGQLASGLIKGVLGINAGVVNVRGAVVNAPGSGVGGGAGGKPGRGGFLGKALPVTAGIAIASIGGGGPMGDQSQITFFRQLLGKTQNVQDAINESHITLGNIHAAANDPAFRAGLTTDQLAAIDALAVQVGVVNQTAIKEGAELTRLRADSSRYASSATQQWSASQRAAYAQLSATGQVRDQAEITAARTADVAVSSRITAGKDFSPTVVANLNATINTNVSVDNVIRSITSSRVSSGWQESTLGAGI